jgi:hypothetical protein
MVKLVIKKIDDKTIEVEDVLKGTVDTLNAAFRAKGNNNTGTVLIEGKDCVLFFGDYSEIEVDTFGVLTNVSDTVTALNSFIGNFNSRGSASETTLPGFIAGKKYHQDQAITQNDIIYVAKEDFEAGDEFDAEDWKKVSTRVAAGVGIRIEGIGDGVDWVNMKLAAPSPEADPEEAASARETGEAIQRVEDIAAGAKVGLAFDTTEQLNEWLAGTYERADGKTPADLQTGWDLYIIALNEPDYWWDGTGIQMLETKVDLSEYYTKTETNNRFVKQTDLRTSIFVEKLGINSLIYPKYFCYDKDLTVSKVILSGNAAGASFSVDGTDYDEEELLGVTVPAGVDLIISDIDIKAGYDTGSITIIF